MPPERTLDAADRESVEEPEPDTVAGIRVAVATHRVGADGRHHPHLIVLAGEYVGRTYRLDQADLVIGRSDNAQIRLRDEGISRRHARLFRVGAEVWIEDMQSVNGTLVNSAAVSRCLLHDGDKIHLGGQTILKFSESDAIEEGFHQAMYEAAVRDGITHTYNKRHFLERLATEIAYSRRHRSPLALLMLDVDHFKKVNDDHGHLAGDHVLGALGQIVMDTVRTEDLVARYGGEEFAVLCRDTTLPNAALLAERLRRAVEAFAFVYRDRRLAITVSVGVALCSEDSYSAQQLIAEADRGLYQAKAAGRNRVGIVGMDGAK